MPGTGDGGVRSTAIVLFTDLVGSTELRSRLGENAAEELRHKHDALVADAIHAGRGRLVKHLGDADWAAAERYFAVAAATHERIGAPSWLARTRVEWARMLLARAEPGDAERADDLLRQALGTARELGLLNIERNAAALLTQGDRVSDW